MAEAERQRLAAIQAAISSAQVFGAQREAELAAKEAERQAAIEVESKRQVAVEAEKQAQIKRLESIAAQALVDAKTPKDMHPPQDMLADDFINNEKLLGNASDAAAEAEIQRQASIGTTPAAESNKTLLIGGVILAAVIVYFLTKKND